MIVIKKPIRKIKDIASWMIELKQVIFILFIFYKKFIEWKLFYVKYWFKKKNKKKIRRKKGVKFI